MKATKLLPLFGILAVALIVASFVVIGDTPDTDDPAQKIAAFYTDNDAEVTTGALLLLAASAAFLGWAVQLRSAFMAAEAPPATRTTLGLVGAVVFAVGLTIFAGLNFALGDVPEKLDPSGLQTLHLLNESMFPPLALGTFTTLLGFGLATLATRVLPGWLGWLAVVAAILTATPLWFVPFLGLGVLIIVSSVLLATRRPATA
jgi:hypothetical protein